MKELSFILYSNLKLVYLVVEALLRSDMHFCDIL